MHHPIVFCMCGTSRYANAQQTVTEALTMSGHIVLPLCIYSHAQNLELTAEQEEMLVNLWRHKCQMSDFVCLVAPGGYIGTHTKGDLVFASSQKKRILVVPASCADAVKQQCPELDPNLDFVSFDELGIYDPFPG